MGLRSMLFAAATTLIVLAICLATGVETLGEHPFASAALIAAAAGTARLLERRGPVVADAFVLACAWSLSPTTAALAAWAALVASRRAGRSLWRLPAAAAIGALLTWAWVAHPPATLGRAIELALGALLLAAIDAWSAERIEARRLWGVGAAMAGAWALAPLLVPPQPWPLAAIALASWALVLAPAAVDPLRGGVVSRLVGSLAHELPAHATLDGRLAVLQSHAVRLAPVIETRWSRPEPDGAQVTAGKVTFALERRAGARERSALEALAAVASPALSAAASTDEASRESQTGLPNRERFAEWVAEARARLARFERGASIAVVERDDPDDDGWLARRRATDRVAAVAPGRYLWLLEECGPEAVAAALDRTLGDGYRFGAVALDAETPLAELLLGAESELKRRPS